jgi:ABC-type glycerol-3-phosphate transport system substrate-binding protein
MKKLLMLLIVLSLAGFAFAEGAQEKEGTATAAGMPEQLEMTKAYFFGEPGDNPEQKEEWVDWMSERYGTQFKVNAFPRPEYMTKFALAMQAGDIKGLGWIFGGTYMSDYHADGSSMVIEDEWLEDNATWQSLPAGMKAGNKREGDLLALPSGYTSGLPFNRGVRLDWLENLGMEKPETIYELWDVVKAYTENDPDGNGKDDTIGMTSAGVWNIQDIFHSYDAHTNHVGAHCIIAGPNDDYSWVDGMLKPGAKEALQWLRDAYEAGYLDQELFTNGGSDMRDRMSSGQYGSTYYWGNWTRPYGSFQNRLEKVNPDAKMDLLLGLTSEYLDKNTNPGPTPFDEASGTGGGGVGVPWIVIYGTREPAKQVNAFVNIFFGDEIGWVSGRYGVYEKYWTFGPDGEIVRLAREKKEDGSCSYYGAPGIVTDVDDLGLSLTGFGYRLECWTEEQAERVQKRNEITAMYIQKGQETGDYFSYGKFKEPQSETYKDINANINTLFEETVAAAVTGTKTVDQALADYRKEMRAMGAQAVLEQANAYVDKPVLQQY